MFAMKTALEIFAVLLPAFLLLAVIAFAAGRMDEHDALMGGK